MRAGVHIDDLRALAVRLDAEWTLEDTPDGSIVPMDDSRDTSVEHMLHEMSHAVLLDVPLGPLLATRVGDAVRALPLDREQTLNEIETFALVIETMTAFGYKVDLHTMVDACDVQVHGSFTRDEIEQTWRNFRRSKRCRMLKEKIIAAVVAEGGKGS